MEIYVYADLSGNLGLIRRSIIQESFNGKEDMVLNYNPHTSLRAGIGKIICPKVNADIVVR